MNESSQPLVSVLTPVYNGEKFIKECIESVLRQTYKNFEYIIVNNCSTDRTLEIALTYSKKDSRVRVHNNNKFVGVIENHNIAFSLISSEAKYCKVVSADDFIFPDCIMQMVEVAEANPSAGIIGSYQLSGSYIRWQGFKYPQAFFAGREICRQIFLGNQRLFGFGNPTSILYRADIVRNSEKFYPNSSPHADTSACFKHLKVSDYGFVYQILSYATTHDNTQSSKSADINRYSSAYINDLIQYGPFYLNKEELKKQLRRKLNKYYQYLAANIIGFRGKEFWDYHKGRLKELGYPITFTILLKASIIKILRELLNPVQAFKKLFKHYSSKS